MGEPSFHYFHFRSSFDSSTAAALLTSPEPYLRLCTKLFLAFPHFLDESPPDIVERNALGPLGREFHEQKYM